MPEFQKAWKDAYVILAGGTTNAFIAQELLGDMSIEPGRCTVGLSCEGLLCVTEPESRKSFPNVFYKGQPVDKKIDEALQDPSTWRATWVSSPAASTGARCPTSSGT